MYRELKKKRLILDNRKPFLPETALELRKMAVTDMIYTTARLEDLPLSREDISAALEGELIKDATIREYTIIENYKNLFNEMESMSEMGDNLTLRTVARLYEIISNETAEYRKSNPTSRDMGFTPPHKSEVAQHMQTLINRMNQNSENEPSNYLLKAAYFHNKFIWIQPYTEYSVETARACVWYFMMRNGYPVFAMNFSKEEYVNAVAQYILKGDISPIYKGLERSLYNKMEIMLNMTRRS